MLKNTLEIIGTCLLCSYYCRVNFYLSFYFLLFFFIFFYFSYIFNQQFIISVIFLLELQIYQTSFLIVLLSLPLLLLQQI
ncbi:hypothetical protein C1645_10457 [Glomus cerebriforme]|uniref:Uncharacterized protein n=1 Tax=Glomus cerebriforme TaxID=658196 RepID=A0A397TEX9_9GLOM|nr:hypothetical protein C1645_10457 [Glomus cerebriforme]